MSPLTIKLAIAVVLAAAIGAGSFYLGGLGPKAALATYQLGQARVVADAVIAQQARDRAEAINDNQAEKTHAADIQKIDDLPAIASPLIVYRTAPRGCTVSSTQAQASGITTHTPGGGGEPVDRGSNIRPAVEALKKRLEKVMADYRQEDQEWPR